MIDSHRIEEELKDVKLTSMTDVVNFVIGQVYKMMSYDPIQDLSYRITQLEKPKGLDQIMIQQVKTLIEAILEQKQDQIRRDLQRTVHNNVEIALQQQNSRRSLKQIDLFELINTANQSRKSSVSSVPKNTHQTHPTLQNNISQNNFNTDSLKKEIHDIKILLDKKAERRQFNDRILDIQKQMSGKMSIKEAQNIVSKFQKQVFNKMNENYLQIQKMQYGIKKSLMEDFNLLKRDMNDNSKVKQVRSGIGKIDKKMRKIQNQFEDLNQKVNKETISIKNEVKDSIDQVCNLLESIGEEKKKKIPVKHFLSGVWFAETQFNLNNMAISWSKELFNDDSDQLIFEAKKSQIMIAQSGYYRIQILIAGCQNAPNLFINSEFCEKIQSQPQKAQNSPYSLVELINITQNRSLLSIRLESNNVYTSAFLKVTKLGKLA